MSQARELQGAERAADAYWRAHFFARQPRGSLYGGQLVAWRRLETGATPRSPLRATARIHSSTAW